MTNNNRKAPREFWISQIYESSIDVFLTEMEAIKAAWNEDSQNVIHVREVLPNEPSAEEVFERVIEYLNGTTCNQMHIDDLKSKRDEILKGAKG